MHTDILLYYKARSEGLWAVGCVSQHAVPGLVRLLEGSRVSHQPGLLDGMRRKEEGRRRGEASIITEKRERRERERRRREKLRKNRILNEVNYYVLLFCLQTEWMVIKTSFCDKGLPIWYFRHSNSNFRSVFISTGEKFIILNTKFSFKEQWFKFYFIITHLWNACF